MILLKVFPGSLYINRLYSSIKFGSSSKVPGARKVRFASHEQASFLRQSMNVLCFAHWGGVSLSLQANSSTPVSFPIKVPSALYTVSPGLNEWGIAPPDTLIIAVSLLYVLITCNVESPPHTSHSLCVFATPPGTMHVFWKNI